MIDTLLYLYLSLLPYLGALAFLILVVKLYHFKSNRTSSWRPSNFFYFDHSAIETSNSENGQRNKRTQNMFSVTITILMAIVLLGLLFRNKLLE